MKLFLIILAVSLLFFVPIPIKFSIYYSTTDYYIKLYRFIIISKNKDKFKEKLKKNIQPEKPEKNKKNTFPSIFFKKIKYKLLLNCLRESKFKPVLKLKLSLDYSLTDAAKTAILYGLLCQIPSVIFFIMTFLFKVNKYKISINPMFEDKFLLKFETSSIIFISFANIINMIVILFKAYERR